ncbi:GtrA family protein [Oharaeibacter diazotrophicus]|uniref:Putative flippase GtrA n=1 Tax=Oharaeibacter diazotrophicus TaxID=1920512 RepID=A0A4R6RFQ0_9HYPH|nr:GtrA family protein [Oharaeibacter diazotrophicus]TDP85014.1 putative flippase GtrA [Oharaeibacter diazotrophicus]BBE73984.1 GtrA-like protein [Pleomorphomonas sp. SM30]GLS76330.1 hypothetical protein GCM10007904_16650 [Oharaeibacter diazotrophicus]
MTPADRFGRYARFLVVGGLGFAVDAGATELLVLAGLPALGARVAAIALAMTTTYLLNRRLTFRSDRRGAALLAEGGRYFAVAIGAAAFNYAVFALVLTIVPGIRPALAVAVASVAAMVLSYLGYSTLVFRRRP